MITGAGQPTRAKRRKQSRMDRETKSCTLALAADRCESYY